MASYLAEPDNIRAPDKSPSHETPSRTLDFAGLDTPQGPPLSPYRDPNVEASEAPTPSRTPQQRDPAPAAAPAPASAEDDEAESLRLAMELQGEEERYLQMQQEGEERLARLEAERAERGDEEGDAEEGDEDEGSEGSEEEDDEEIDESLALAWRLQQEDDDRALLMALNGGREPPEGVTDARNLSPSQMTYDQLLELGDNIGKVSKGAAQNALSALPTVTYGCRHTTNAIVGEQCAICRMEFEASDVLRILPCRHAEHADCLDQWLRMNRSCPLCQQDVAPRADADESAAAPAADTGETNFTAADTDDIDDLLGI